METLLILVFAAIVVVVTTAVVLVGAMALGGMGVTMWWTGAAIGRHGLIAWKRWRRRARARRRVVTLYPRGDA